MSVRPSRRLLLPDRRLRLCAADARALNELDEAMLRGGGVRRRTAAAHRVAPSQPGGRTQRRRARSGTARPATGLRHLRTRLGRPFRRQPLRIRPQQGIAQLRTDRRTGRDRRPDGTRTDRPGRDALPADRYGRNDDARIPELVCAVQRDRMAAAGRSHRSRRTPGMARFAAPHPAHPHRRRIPSCIHPHSGTGARTGRQRPPRRSLCRAGTLRHKELAPGTRRCSITTWGRSPNRQDRKSAPSSTTRARPSPTCKPERAHCFALQPRAAALRERNDLERASRYMQRTLDDALACKSGARIPPSLRRPPRRSTAPWSTTWPSQPVAAVDDGRHVAAAGHLRRSLRQRTPPAAAVAAAGGNWPSPMPNSVKRTGS